MLLTQATFDFLAFMLLTQATFDFLAFMLLTQATFDFGNHTANASDF